MKIIFTTTVALLFAQFLTAQNAISGTVRDENSEPLPFIAVELLDASTNFSVKNGLTDAYGQFNFSEVPTGKYIVKARFATQFEVFSEKLSFCGKSMSVPDLQFPKNAMREKKSGFAEKSTQNTAEVAFTQN